MSGARISARLFAGAVVSLAVGVLAGAGVASASEDDYIHDLNSSGIDGSRADRLSMGYTACSEKNQGTSRDESIKHIVSTGLTEDKADFVYDSALKNLCGS
jgi:hypothetical protein